MLTADWFMKFQNISESEISLNNLQTQPNKVRERSLKKNRHVC